MSIASELNNYRNGLDDAWDAAEDMGATIPHDRNMVNLDDAIRTIPVSSPNDGVLTIQQNGTTLGTFTADQATNTTVNINTSGEMTQFYVSHDYLILNNDVTLYKEEGLTTAVTAQEFNDAYVAGPVRIVVIGNSSSGLMALDSAGYYDDGTDAPSSMPDVPFYCFTWGYQNETFEFTDPGNTGTVYYWGHKQSQGKLTAGSNITISGDTISATDTTYSDFTGATSSVAGSNGLVPAPAAGDQEKVLHGDGTWKDTTAKLVEMSYGESNAWAKFIAAYNAGSIVYCRASSNANPGTGSQTRKAFMAYVNNATSPTNVEFQYVRSNSSKSDSQQCDQVFVYKLTNASGGTWTVESRNMAPKINVSGPITKTFSNGANATLTLGADAMTGATSSTAGAAGVVPAPAAGDQGKVLTGNGSWTDIFNLIYPVGSIYMSVNNTDPGTLFGGTWSAWGAGRVPVGVDANDENFDTVEETGGEKTHTLTVEEMPNHYHNLGQMYDGYHLTGTTSQPRGVYADFAQAIHTTSVGGGEAHNNLQPYITCYMWKRTA